MNVKARYGITKRFTGPYEWTGDGDGDTITHLETGVHVWLYSAQEPAVIRMHNGAEWRVNVKDAPVAYNTLVRAVRALNALDDGCAEGGAE